MTEKQPEIYQFIESKFKEARDYNDKKFSEIYERLGDMRTDIEVIKQKERPSPNCRDLILELVGATDEKCKVVKEDIDNVSRKISKRVTWGLFWMIIGSAFLFTIGSYIYTYNTNIRIDAIIVNREEKR